MQLIDFKKTSFFLSGRKNLSVAVMIGRPFKEEELQVNQLKHKALPPQTHCATLTPDKESNMFKF